MLKVVMAGHTEAQTQQQNKEHRGPGPIQGPGAAMHQVAEPKHPSRRHNIWLLLLATAAICIGIGAGAYAWKYRASTPISAPVDHISVGNVGEYSIFNLIAKEKGYFAQNGLDVDVTEYQSGPPAVDDLLAGHNDIAVAADFVAVNKLFTTDQLRILAQASQQYVFSLVVRKDKSITKGSDLKGKKIGVTKTGAGDFFLGRYLNQNGLSTADVTEVNLSPADMTIQLTSGQLDAVIMFEPYPYNLLKNLGNAVTAIPVQGDMPTVAVVYTSKYVLDTKPDVVKRYIRSLAEAETFLNEHDQEARQQLKRAMNYDDAYVAYLWPKIRFHLSLDPSLVMGMEEKGHFLINEHVTAETKLPNYTDYIYFDALESADPAAVTIDHP